ncbi:KAP family NTPase [Campylobacter jejuni]|nr:AAA family ATPase [Campylobacter jejuni]ECR2149510.1 AAA family ATPase [Campylobacter jejuni]ECR2239457.1 AAA family ATPase [Campylobacter jejuni]ECR2271355.1 AAA family ATPase [Campylobacter jejuni]EDP6582015.1 AAA family ATPase [Campylobacter jejuni]
MNKIDNIANFLNKKSKKCLAINGPWGIGKTHLWKQVEKKLSEDKKEKKVVYIDLFGKESYKQILEEIVFKIHGNYNKIMNTFSQITTKIAKVKSAGTININPDAIFSFLKKEDFNNIIVCFDNIERRSDNLSLKEILGLVNLLKEEKECNVVMIFHKDELEEQDNNSAINDKEKQAKQDNSKNWYQTYKEKIIDYEFVINDNSKAAHNIISNGVKYDKEVQNIIFECYQNSCNNLRLLLRFVEHIIYFNKECFMKIKKEDYSNEIFFGGLKMYYDILLNCIKKYYSYNTDKKQYQSIFEKYFDDSCYLNQDDLDTLKSHFESDLKEKTRIYFNKCKDKYLYSNLNDIDFAKYIEDLLPKFKNYIYENGTYYSITYYQRFFKLYKKITSKELDCKKNIEKNFIKELAEYEFNISISHDPFHENFYKEIKDMIEKNEEYKNYYQELQSEKHKKININSFLNGLSSDKIRQTFSTNNIWQYNHFEIESIAKSFQTNNDFYHEFFIFFSSAMDVQMLQKYELKNNLFQAYSDFLDLEENKIKKEEILKIIKEQNHDCILLKLITS